MQINSYYTNLVLHNLVCLKCVCHCGKCGTAILMDQLVCFKCGHTILDETYDG